MKLKADMEYKKIMIVLLLGFIILGFLVTKTEYFREIDLGIIKYLSQSRSPFLLNFAKVISFMGTVYFYSLLSLGIIGYFFKKRDYKNLKLYLITILSATALAHIMKLFYERVRPVEFFRATETSYSFPSAHAMVAMAVYLLLATISKQYFEHRKAIYVISALFILLMGWSRVYLGVHWPTDVIGGYLGGAIVFLLILNIELKK